MEKKGILKLEIIITIMIATKIAKEVEPIRKLEEVDEPQRQQRQRPVEEKADFIVVGQIIFQQLMLVQ